MSGIEKQLASIQKNTLAVVRKQLDVTDRLLNERSLTLMPDVFNVPADGSFEEAVQRVRPDGLISIAAGKYILETGVKITKPVRIKGAGRDLTIIESSVEGTIICIKADGLFAMEDVGILKNGEHNGDVMSVSTHTVDLKSCALTGNRSDTNTDWETYFDQPPYAALRICHNTSGTITDSKITNYMNGMIIEGNVEIILKNCFIDMHIDIGIQFKGSSSGTLENSIISHNNCGSESGKAICVTDYSKVNLIGNQIENNGNFGGGGGGISFSKSAFGKVENNNCNRNSYGITVEGQSEVKLLGNLFEGNDYGIDFGGSSIGTVKNNIISNNAFGISISEKAAVDVIRNHCEKNGMYCISYGGSTSGIVENNICIKSGCRNPYDDEVRLGGGISVGGQSKVVLVSNHCEDNEACGIDIGSISFCVVENNICRRNKWDGIRVTDQSKVKLIGNQCDDNNLSGIFFSDSSEGLAENNRCIRNSGYGIRMSNTSNIVLVDNYLKDNQISDVHIDE